MCIYTANLANCEHWQHLKIHVRSCPYYYVYRGKIKCICWNSSQSHETDTRSMTIDSCRLMKVERIHCALLHATFAQLNFHTSIAHQDLFAPWRFTDSCRHASTALSPFFVSQGKSEARITDGWKSSTRFTFAEFETGSDTGRFSSQLNPTYASSNTTLGLCVVSCLLLFHGFIRHAWQSLRLGHSIIICHLCIRICYRYLSHDKHTLLQRNIILGTTKRSSYDCMIVVAKNCD